MLLLLEILIMKVILPIKVFQKLRAYVNATEHEISGLGKIDTFLDEITIEDVRILNQEVGGVETTMDKNSLGKFYDEIIQEEGDLLNWKLWWHSHADMDTFFSGTDQQTIDDFDNETHEDNWMLSLVTNKRGDIEFRLDVFYPIRVTVENMEYFLKYDDVDIDTQVAEEVADKVKEKRYFFPKIGKDTEEEDFYDRYDQYSPNGKHKRKHKFVKRNGVYQLNNK